MMRLVLPPLLLVLAAALGACGSSDDAPSPARCDNCGMVIHEGSGWRAGATGDGDERLRFDTPKCLFRYRQEHPANDAWVIEYYSQERKPAAGLFYVVGTDLEGPMGRDLVPVEGREQAERLMHDHHGERVLSFGEVSDEVVGSLFAPRP